MYQSIQSLHFGAFKYTLAKILHSNYNDLCERDEFTYPEELIDTFEFSTIDISLPCMYGNGTGTKSYSIFDAN